MRELLVCRTKDVHGVEAERRDARHQLLVEHLAEVCREKRLGRLAAPAKQALALASAQSILHKQHTGTHSARLLTQAHSRPMPSTVSVPLPNSSTISSERGVACRSMTAIWCVSHMKELCATAAEMLSEVATRVKMRSVSPTVAASAGTKLPT
jgi:hypothetical protein